MFVVWFCFGRSFVVSFVSLIVCLCVSFSPRLCGSASVFLFVRCFRFHDFFCVWLFVLLCVFCVFGCLFVLVCVLQVVCFLFLSSVVCLCGYSIFMYLLVSLFRLLFLVLCVLVCVSGC